MSQLLDKLDRAGDRFIQPLGFGGAAKREPVSPILVLGAIEVGQSDSVAKANTAALDGAVIIATEKTTKAALDKTSKLVNSLMFGVWGDSPQPKEIKGADFEIFSSSSTPLTSLSANERTFVMSIDLELDEGLIRAIDLLPVCAFIIQIPEVKALTINHLLQIGRVSTATSKPIFLHLTSIPLAGDLKDLKDAGIAALVINLQNNSAKEFSELRESLLNLPQKTLDKDRRKVNSSLSHTINNNDENSLPEPDDDFEED